MESWYKINRAFTSPLSVSSQVPGTLVLVVVVEEIMYFYWNVDFPGDTADTNLRVDIEITSPRYAPCIDSCDIWQGVMSTVLGLDMRGRTGYCCCCCDMQGYVCVYVGVFQVHCYKRKNVWYNDDGSGHSRAPKRCAVNVTGMLLGHFVAAENVFGTLSLYKVFYKYENKE